jgi:hypothetical protein
MKKLILLLFLASSNLWAQNLQLIRWFAGADVIGVTNTEESLPSDFVVREFEISAFSQIDYIWQGSLTLSLHNDPGTAEETHTDIHEAFIFSNQLLPGTSVKLGRFFLGFGRLNRFHRHDWAISEAPLYHSEFFGGEAVIDEGIEVSKLLAEDFYLNLTAGITSGKKFKEEHHHEDEEEEFKPADIPTHYLRLSTFHEFSTQKGFEYAVSLVKRTDGDGNKYEYTGFDLTFKNKFGRFYKDLLQFEAWKRKSSEIEEDGDQIDYGAYIYYEKGFDQNHSLGLKLDWYKPQGHDEEEEGHDHGTEINGEFTEISLVYSYYNSEFMRTRLTLSRSKGLLVEEKEVENTKLMLQTVFTIGAHPAHLY